MQARKSKIYSCSTGYLSVSFAMGLALLFLVAGGQQTASAASCKQLGRQLASLDKIQSGSPKYKRAVKKQQKYINQVKRLLRSNKCRRIPLFGSSNSATCKRLKDSLSDMQRHIKTLRKKAAGPRVSNKSRRRIKRAMKKSGCGIQEARGKKSTTASLLKKMFSESAPKKAVHTTNTFDDELENLNNRNRAYNNSGGRRIRAQGRVKTLCVRTCDGYFFPVGFSTGKGKKVPDSEACSNSCPGTEMALYYRRPNNENPKTMISVDTGKPYTELPTAFAYRKRFNPNCSCNYRLLNRTKPGSRGGGLTEIAGAGTIKQSPSHLTTPVWRADRGQDPETIANIGGGWTVESIDPEAEKEQPQTEQKSDRPIRIVGDTFFPSQ